MTIIDSHQHFWKFDPIKDQWITDEMKLLKNDFLPQNLIPVYQQNKVSACVVVQADTSETETNFLLDLADSNDFILGVVGWLDLCAENISERLTFYSQYEKLKGVRMLLQQKPKGFMGQKDFKNGIGQLAAFKMSYDLLIYPHQLEEANTLVGAFPKQTFILDHLAKPNIRKQPDTDWKKGIQKIAQHPNIACKVSGMVTEANWNQWKTTDFIPYLDWIITCFGTDRLLFGSDWPVCLLSGNYTQVLGIVKSYFSRFSKEEQEAIFANNAKQYYRL